VRAALTLQQICVGAPEILVESSDVVRDALAVVSDDVAHAQLLGLLSGVLAFEGRDDEAVATGELAVAAARACADDGTVAEIMHMALYAGWLDPNRLERQLALCREGVERARRAGHDNPLLRMLIKEGFGAYAVGDGARLRRLLPEQRRLARRVRQPLILTVDAAMQGIEALAYGRLAEAERLTEEFESWLRHISHPVEGYGVMMFAIRREQGRLAELRPLVEMIGRLGQEDATWWPGLAALYAELGMDSDAGRVLDRLAAQPTIGARDILQPVTLSYVADAVAATGHPIAAAAYARLEPWAGRAVSAAALACYGSADRYLGRLAEACGRHAAASAHYEAAVRFDEAAGWPLWAAHSKLALGAHLLRAGGRADRDRGLGLVEEAQRVAAASGLVGLAEHCSRVLVRTDVTADDRPAASPPSAPGPMSLTAREKEILRLIAEGRTNREVGELLHTSQHTVANQVHGILVKSGCANRAEAIAWAHRHHLLD
jgi:DNA-binding CsgD family transcriptional regulator